jgi:hypothetical protein
MQRNAKKFYSFIGFLTAVWCFGGTKQAEAKFPTIKKEDLRADSAQNKEPENFDDVRFSRSGEVITEKRVGGFFAKVCRIIYVMPTSPTDIKIIKASYCDYEPV